MANRWTSAPVSGSPAVLVAEGGLGALFGVVVLAWPGPTATVLAALFAAQLFATGVVQLVVASSEAVGTGERVLSCGLATLSLLIGLLCLRSPLQTPQVLGLLVGVMWVVGGAIRVGQGVLTASGAPRGWRIASGALWLLAGGFALEYPGARLVAIATLLGVVLILQGALLIAGGLTVRRSGNAPDVPHGPVRLTEIPPVRPRAPL
ncbi:MAG TPA: DUF308 domain-containing protein [Blastococcus sp.]|nr:DUF308 domain-containing protein [Blastococcus sp.]